MQSVKCRRTDLRFLRTIKSIPSPIGLIAAVRNSGRHDRGKRKAVPLPRTEKTVKARMKRLLVEAERWAVEIQQLPAPTAGETSSLKAVRNMDVLSLTNAGCGASILSVGTRTCCHGANLQNPSGNRLCPPGQQPGVGSGANRSRHDGAAKKYRDDDKRLKRQAAGFWVYAYDDADPSTPPVLVEVGPGKPVAAIEWTVHLANRKAAWFKFDGLTGSGDILNPPLFGYPAGSLRNPSPPLTDADGRRKQWVIDPGPRTLSAPGILEFRKGSGGGFPESWPAPFRNGNAPGIEMLGLMQVHPDFSLTVVGGSGNSGSINNSPIVNYANNPGWFDDTSDGPVKATLLLDNGSRVEAAPAWVVVGPPDFAPPIENIITLYDAIYDIGLRFLSFDPSIYAGGQFLAAFTPSFERDVYPILRRAFMYRWVYNEDLPSAQLFTPL